MMFKQFFELYILDINNKEFSLGTFPRYADAYDYAVIYASEELPKERVKAFRIQETIVNLACYDNLNAH